MCGIVSAVSRRDVVPFLLEGLERLEYRGYDSAGLAVINGRLHRLRAVGRVAELARLARDRTLSGCIGIAHTRWATHGAPSERNAHPHVSAGVSVVHNGIIENHAAIRRELQERGYAFTSETDTEVIAHLVHACLTPGTDLLTAVRQAVGRLVGAYAIAVLSDASPARLVVARHGAPLLLGLGDRENFAASDTAALIRLTRRIVHLEDGDCAEIAEGGVRIVNAAGQTVERPVQLSQLDVEAVERGAWSHFMQKEIFEQPAALARTLDAAIAGNTLADGLFGDVAGRLAGVRQVSIVACGTSLHAGQVGRHWLEALAGLPCQVEIASEFRYRQVALAPDSLVISLSQSGETADTLAAVAAARELSPLACLAVCNVAESALMRGADLAFLSRAGPEIGVASTKAFTTQLLALFLLALLLARQRGRLSAAALADQIAALRRLPDRLMQALRLEAAMQDWAARLAGDQHALFLGRGAHAPIAAEGALKLKEISYIHAEAYAAGELKHGPLALVTPAMPVIALAPGDRLQDKLASNLQEVRARGGRLFVLADRGCGPAAADGVDVARLPAYAGLLSPIVHVVPLQLLAYHAALERHNDVDKPRNLAKSVTVE